MKYFKSDFRQELIKLYEDLGIVGKIKKVILLELHWWQK